MLGGYSTAQRNQMTALRELKLTLGLLWGLKKERADKEAVEERVNIIVAPYMTGVLLIQSPAEKPDDFKVMKVYNLFM